RPVWLIYGAACRPEQSDHQQTRRSPLVNRGELVRGTLNRHDRRIAVVAGDEVVEGLVGRPASVGGPVFIINPDLRLNIGITENLHQDRAGCRAAVVNGVEAFLIELSLGRVGNDGKELREEVEAHKDRRSRTRSSWLSATAETLLAATAM